MAKSDTGTYNEVFSEQFQDHILAVAARHPNFVIRYRSALHHTYFSSELGRATARGLLNLVDQYRQLPSQSTLLEEVRTLVGNDTFDAAEKFLGKLFADNISDTKAVMARAIEFGKTQAMVNAVLESADFIDKGERQRVLSTIKDALVVGEDVTDIGIDFKVTAEERRKWYEDREVEDVIPTGIAHLDYALDGGFARGELYVVLAPPKKGKTTTVINLGFGALRRPIGCRVAHYSLEMSQKKVIRRYDDRLSVGAFPRRLDEDGKLIQPPEKGSEMYVQRLTDRANKFITGHLFVKSYATRAASISTLRAHLSLLETQGFYPDVIVADYADIMKPERRLGEMRHEQAGIYEDLLTLAGEYNAVVITGSQAKVGALEKETLDIGDFAEAFEKAAIMDGGIAFCLHYDQGVVTDHGTMKIGDIGRALKRGVKLKALSHNFRTGKDEFKLVTNWFNNGRADKPFIRVRTEITGLSKGSVTTPDHHYFLADGREVPARRLREGVMVLGRAHCLGGEREQVLLGSLLGDGHLEKTGRLRIDHGDKQKAYLQWKIAAFKGLCTDIAPRRICDKFGDRVTWQGRVGTCLAFRRARADWYATESKEILDGALDALGDLGLAVWFMDDATISKQDGRICLHYQGFNRRSRQLCLDWFASQGWSGLENRGRFQFDAASSRSILRRVHCYFVPSHDVSRATKRWVAPRLKGRIKREMIPVRVESVSEWMPFNRSRYDIEVAGNHNFYLASNVLVHNCQTFDERVAGECRLVLVGLRSAEDHRVIRCTIRRDKCFIRSTGLYSIDDVPIPTDADVDEDEDTETTTRVHKAAKVAKLKRSAGIKKPKKKSMTGKFNKKARRKMDLPRKRLEAG